MIRPEQLRFRTEHKDRRWIARCDQLPSIRVTGQTRVDALDEAIRQACLQLREADRQPITGGIRPTSTARPRNPHTLTTTTKDHHHA